MFALIFYSDFNCFENSRSFFMFYVHLSFTILYLKWKSFRSLLMMMIKNENDMRPIGNGNEKLVIIN
jgi:hypothetical protein